VGGELEQDVALGERFDDRHGDEVSAGTGDRASGGVNETGKRPSLEL
jgi:hypothetical protein